MATVTGGNTLYLYYPGNKAFWDGNIDHSFDIQFFLEEYNGTGDNKEMPVHNDLFSDLWWKLKEAHLSQRSPQLVDEWKHGMAELYAGKSPNHILRDRPNLGDFTVGQMPNVLLNTTYWIFLQEDINYPRSSFDGRKYTYDPVTSILNSSEVHFGTNSGHYGGTQDSDEYARYHQIVDDIKKHKGGTHTQYRATVRYFHYNNRLTL